MLSCFVGYKNVTKVLKYSIFACNWINNILLILIFHSLFFTIFSILFKLCRYVSVYYFL